MIVQVQQMELDTSLRSTVPDFLNGVFKDCFTWNNLFYSVSLRF